MGAFEKWYLKANSAFSKFSKKARKYIDVSKLKIKLAECENSIGKKYKTIGEIICNKIEANEVLDKSDVLELVDDINALKKESAEYEEKINSLKGKCACKFCNSLNNSGSQFCSSCGNSLICREYEDTGDTGADTYAPCSDDSIDNDTDDKSYDSNDFSEN